MRSTRHLSSPTRRGTTNGQRLTATVLGLGLAVTGVVGGAGAASAAPAAGSALGLTALAATTDPTAAVTAYVTAVYRDLFRRTPDAGGLQDWTSRLLGGTPRGAVANAITSSAEFRSGLIRESYSAYLGRAPEAAGAAFWLDRLIGGYTQQQLEAGFMASDEYYLAAASDPATWVSNLYRDILHRSPSAGEVAHWTGRLAAGDGRYGVAMGFTMSTEHLTALINVYYGTLLGRSIDPSGASSWVGAIQRGSRIEDVIAGVVSSDEYVNRNGGWFASTSPAPAAATVDSSSSTPGWLRTSSNTGLAAVGTTSAMLTKYTGSLTVTGRLYRQRIDLGANQLVLGNGAVLEECLITGTRNGGQGQVRITGAGVQILNTDIVGSASSSGESMGIFSDNLNGARITSVRMTGFTIFLWLDSGSSSSTPVSVIDGFYGSDQIAGAAHHDGLTRRGGQAPLILQNSRISMTTGSTTGAVFLQSTWGNPVGGLTVTRSYLEGNGYPATIEASNTVTFDDNRFRATEYGPITKSGSVPGFSWVNNYVYANNAAAYYRGSLISAP